jgi:hypothetical protein
MMAATPAVIALAALLGLSACSPAAPLEPAGAPATAVPDPSAPPDAVPTTVGAAPAVQPGASATDTLPFFDSVNVAVTRVDPSAGGRAFIDALAAAGFDRGAMEVTADTTTIGEPADSIQFAVRFAGECLVGQYGPASGGYHGAVRPALGTGACLVGRTRPIDW